MEGTNDLTFELDVASYLEHGSSSSAITAVYYMYRDAANYKTNGVGKIYGVVAPEVFARLDALLYDGDSILPEQLGFSSLSPIPGADGYDEDHDHDLHEITDVVWFANKGRTLADCSTSAEAFLAAVMALEAGGQWDFVKYGNQQYE